MTRYLGLSLLNKFQKKDEPSEYIPEISIDVLIESENTGFC